MFVSCLSPHGVPFIPTEVEMAKIQESLNKRSLKEEILNKLVWSWCFEQSKKEGKNRPSEIR